MKLTKSELFKQVHETLKCRNIAYYGSYRKAFAVVMKDYCKHGWPVWSWDV